MEIREDKRSAWGHRASKEQNEDSDSGFPGPHGKVEARLFLLLPQSPVNTDVSQAGVKTGS